MEKRDKVKRPRRALSLKVSFMLYVTVFLIVALVASTLVGAAITTLRDRFIDRYEGSYEEKYLAETDQYVIIYDATARNMSDRDRFLYRVFNDIGILSIPVVCFGCILAAGLLFYHNKLRRPIHILNDAAHRIAYNDLDFSIEYETKNELGRLCDSFESMRSALLENNRELWRQMEERKRLNAAFSHDLRTPLTVLKGYNDMLLKYLPMDRYPKDKVLDTARTMSSHITRLERYVSAMNQLQKLEDIAVERRYMEAKQLFADIQSCAQILCRDQKLQFEASSTDDMVYVDDEVVSQVCENLMSNALRYAHSCIHMALHATPGSLQVIVSDDGPGFSPAALINGSAPFFRSDRSSPEEHFGIGLNICKILCEKHSGALLLENSPQGGARVTACFREKLASSTIHV